MSTKTPRPIAYVIDAILAVVPDTFPGKEVLATDLGKVRKSAMYQPPEAQAQLWRRMQIILNNDLGNPSAHEWGELVARIMGGTEDYRLHLPKDTTEG